MPWPAKPIRCRARRQERGFSLVELVMVLAIMAVLAAVAMPRWSESLGRYRAEAAARRIVADVALAQASARATSAPEVITFDPATEQYSIGNVKDLTTRAGLYTVRLKEAPYFADLSSADFSTAKPLTFSAFGIPSAGGTVMVTCGVYSKTVTIDAGSGVATFP